MTTLRASIDIGSNSILLLVVDVDNNFEVLANESNVTGLGRDLDKNKKFIQVAMDESFEVLKKYKKICHDLSVPADQIIATATEASRVSQNAFEFFKKVEQEIGLTIITITGEAEAYYSAIGVLFDKNIQDETITIMDIGGASTELIQVEKKPTHIISSFSMPVGVVRMNNWQEEAIRLEKLEKILDDFSAQISKVSCTKLYCVAGTMTSVGNMFLKLKTFEETQVNGLEIKTTDINEMLIRYETFTPDQFLEKYPFLGKRAKTIYSGLLLSKTILDKLGTSDIYISTYGLRYGTILSGSIKDHYVWKRI